MFKTTMLAIASFLLCISLIGCSDTIPTDGDSMHSSQYQIGTPRSLAKTLYGPWFDASGQVEMRYWENTVYGSICHVEVPVDEGFVLVGGGAWADYGAGQGALLTASYPKDDFTTWVAESKDHFISSPHYLHVYAIGIRLNGVSRSTLLNYMDYSSQLSPVMNHPSTSATVHEGYRLIGGGARVFWYGYGNLLTASYPLNGYTWSVGSKDHHMSDPSRIQAYAIGITTGNIPGFGTLTVRLGNVQSGYVAGGPVDIESAVDYGYVYSCWGGRSTWTNYGRLLTRIGPSYVTNHFFVSSKDHMFLDGGTTSAHFIEIQKQ